MSTGHEVNVWIEIGGVDTEVTAVFDIDAFSTPDDYWTGGGSGPETVVQEIFYAWDKDQKRDIYKLLEGLRDLELQRYGNGQIKHDCGFKYVPGHGTAGPQLIFNENRSLAGRVEELVNQHVCENEHDYYPEPDPY